MHQRLRWVRAVQQSVCHQLPWLSRSIASGMTNRQLAVFSAVPISGVMYAIGVRGGKIMRGILIVLTLVLATLVAPKRSYAQSDQVIILACTSTVYPAYRETLTLDLTKRTVGRSSAATLETMIQISAEQIIWNSSGGMTNTLNRYTGQLSTSHTQSGVSQVVSDSITCQKQQKQF
jgi:hypothetical protein